jgi:sarcosine oxidase, subunit alpha
VVLATGTYAVPPLLPRNDMPGILAARGLARVLLEDGLIPGRRAVVLGGGVEANALAEKLWKAGMQVRPATAVAELRGGRRIRAVVLSHGERVACDTLAVDGPRPPAIDLARQAGASLELDPETKGWRVVVSSAGATSLDRLWVAGEVTRPMSAAEAADAGRRAGEAAHADR